MIRRAVVAAVAAVLVAAAPARADGGAPGLAAAAGSRFPDRAFALTLPAGAAVRPDQIRVLENGRPVTQLTIRSAEDMPASRFGVVLAIDTSWSMHGAPLRGAIAAARTFIAHRSPDQPVALMTFGGDITVNQPFTTDSAALERALAAVRVTGGGSRVIDAGGRAVALIRAAHIPSGSVVLLTDGDDYGSVGTEKQVAATARGAGVRLFTVGLRSGSTDFATLNVLAATTSGEFSAATSTSDLTRIYGRLGARLANQYLVQYRSAEGPHRRVTVVVRVAGLPTPGEAVYVTPALDRKVREPFHESPAARLWSSPGLALLASLAVAALLSLALWLVLRPRGGSLRERLSNYVRADGADGAGRSTTLTGARTRLLSQASQSLSRASWWPALQEKFDVARIAMPPERALLWTGAATLAALGVLPFLIGPLGIVLAPLVPLVARMLLNRRVAKQRRRFADQLPDNLQVIASAMRAGHSLAGALQVVVHDAPEPAKSELELVIADERMGVPLEDAFATVVRRMDSADLSQVALVAALQRETGGNTAEVIDRVNETMRERLALRRMVSSLTAQGRLSRWVLTGIPVVLLILLTTINPSYMSPLYSTALGKALLTVGAVMVVSGSLVIKRIVNIKV